MEKPLDHLELLRARQIQANQVFKPLFYRLQNENDRKAFYELLTAPGLILVDPIQDQLKELVKFKNPGRRFSTNDLESETKKILNGKSADAFGVWIYYPWSNRLVHSLDEEDFINIRTSRNQYKITREERDLLAEKKIGVIGLSVGQSVSVTVAMERLCGELRLADFDTLELNNLNRIRTGIHNLGLAKVYSVAREIAEIDPFLKVTCFPQGLTEENMDEFFTADGKLDLLIEESDGFDIKILSRYKARALQIPVLMEASDRCMVDVERFDLEPNRSILHGIVDHLDVDTLKTLTTNEEKIPYMLDVLGIETSSVRLKASMVEMNQTINTWPQLASAVTMGGGITADVARRLLLNQFTESGRYHVDIEEIIGNKKKNPIRPADAFSHASLDEEKLKAICSKKNYASVYEATTPDLEKIVEAAGMAPSFANRQPWKWAAYENKLFLFLDAGQPGSFTDPQGMGIYNSLGAALENAALKAGELGLEAGINLSPLATEKNLVAVISFKKSSQVADKNKLSGFIAQRQTNRKAGSGKALAAPVLEELAALAEPVNKEELFFITDKEKIMTIAAATGVAERIRLLHPVAGEEFFSAIRWKTASDGIDIKTLELPVLAETALKVVSDSRVADLLYHWEKGIAFEKMTAGLVGSSSALGLVSIPAGSPEALVNAGRLVQKIWLAATKNKLAVHPICIPLYLLKHLGEKDKQVVFSEKIIFDLEYIKKQFLQVFPGLSSREGVFLFRLSEAEAPTTGSLRKSREEIYFKL